MFHPSLSRNRCRTSRNYPRPGYFSQTLVFITYICHIPHPSVASWRSRLEGCCSFWGPPCRGKPLANGSHSQSAQAGHHPAIPNSHNRPDDSSPGPQISPPTDHGAKRLPTHSTHKRQFEDTSIVSPRCYLTRQFSITCPSLLDGGTECGTLRLLTHIDGIFQRKPRSLHPCSRLAAVAKCIPRNPARRPVRHAVVPPPMFQ